MAKRPTKSGGTTTPPDRFHAKPTHSTGKSVRVMSSSMVATYLDVSRNTVQAWINRGCPVEREPEKKGESYELDLAAVVKWLQAQEIEKALDRAGPAPSSAGGPEKESLEEAQRRRAVALANIAEIEEAEAAGAVIPMAAADQMVIDERILVRTKFENLGSVLAGRTAAITNVALVKAEADRLVAEALATMAGDVHAL